MPFLRVDAYQGRSNVRALPGSAGWGIGFLRNSKPAAFERNSLSNLRLALRSLEVMNAMRQDAKLDYGRTARGTLRIFRDNSSLDRTRASVQGLVARGLQARSLNAAETVELEPALAPIASQLAGAIHYTGDETGDARRFCVALAGTCRSAALRFHFGRDVRSLEVQGGRVKAACTSRETFVADQYVVAAGCESPALVRRLGIALPINPVKGYSVTFECRPGTRSLLIPVVDDALHAAVVPLDGVIRVAGTAELAGSDLTIDPRRIRSLLTLLRRILPQHDTVLDLATARPWCGLRPVSSDGVPIIGRTAIPNLFLNTGQGHLGWTLAAASAEMLSAVILGAHSIIDPAPYSFARFGASP